MHPTTNLYEIFEEKLRAWGVSGECLLESVKSFRKLEEELKKENSNPHTILRAIDHLTDASFDNSGDIYPENISLSCLCWKWKNRGDPQFEEEYSKDW